MRWALTVSPPAALMPAVRVMATMANAQRMADLTAAQWCAENQLTAIKLGKIYPPVGDSDFTCQQMGRQLPGRLVVRPTPNVNFRRVDAQVLDEQALAIVKLSTIVSRF